MNKAYEEYKLEHPEELVALESLKRKSANIERQRKLRRSEKLRRIEECRRILNEEHSE